MKSSKGLLNLIAGISLLFVAQCGHNGTVSDPTAPVNNQGIVTAQEGSVTVQSYAGGRDSLPTVSLADLAALAKGNTDFACDIYRKFSDANSGNTFISPYSMSLALAMTWAGARGQTESQMASALHFTLGQSRLHPAFDALDLSLKSRAAKDGFDLNIVNQLWGEKTFHFLPDFLKTESVSYGASLRLLDFLNNPDASRVTINSWVSDQTQSRIQDLIPQGAITPGTVLVLTNAIYFNAQWADTFRKEDSYSQTFYRESDSVSAVFMHREGTCRYDSGTDYSALEMQYKGSEISMLIILPNPGKMAAVESALSSDFLSALEGALQSRAVWVGIPKFKFGTASISLKNMLSALGMAAAFSDAADFSGIDGSRDLLIQDAIHKAFVSVDERGTEAAAATAVIVGKSSLEFPPPVPFMADRPFIFLIKDNATGTVVFIGKIVSPVVEG
jgi:serpin B